MAPKKIILPPKKIVYLKAIATLFFLKFESTFNLLAIYLTLSLDPFFKEIYLLLKKPLNLASRYLAINLATCLL